MTHTFQGKKHIIQRPWNICHWCIWFQSSQIFEDKSMNSENLKVRSNWETNFWILLASGYEEKWGGWFLKLVPNRKEVQIICIETILFYKFIYSNFAPTINLNIEKVVVVPICSMRDSELGCSYKSEHAIKFHGDLCLRYSSKSWTSKINKFYQGVDNWFQWFNWTMILELKMFNRSFFETTQVWWQDWNQVSCIDRLQSFSDDRWHKRWPS